MSEGARIVITGAGLITPLGLTVEETWEAVRAGRCGIGSVPALESPAPEGKGGGQAVDLPEDYEPGLTRVARYLRRAIGDAMEDAGIATSMPCAADRCGILLGTTLHGMREAGAYLRTGDLAKLMEFPANAVMASAIAGRAIGGIAATTCSACSSSLGAIVLAVTMLKAGELDVVIAGGYDPISDYAYGGFNSLRLVADGPLRPFAKGRLGMKVSEGYGIVVLEREERARRRGARMMAEVLGYGESADSHHLTQPHPEGEGAARAIAGALADAGVEASEIDLIAAHATGTPDNDAGEHAAFARTFGAQLKIVPMVAFKSHLGHTLGGAGAIELILSAMAMRDQVMPACANVRAEEVEFEGLNLITGASRAGRIRKTLNTSLGFGGANTCVVLGPAPRAIEVREGRREPAARDVYITGIGVIFPGIIGARALGDRLGNECKPAWRGDVGSVAEGEYVHLLNARRVRRMSDYVKLTLAATTLAVEDARLGEVPDFGETCAAVLGSMHGSANYCHQYYGEIVRQGLIGANPMLFAEGVPNAAAAHLSLMLSLRGACQTIIGTRTAGLDALRLAAMRIASGRWERAIVGAGEEFYPVINSAYRHFGLHAGEGGGNGPFGGERGFVTSAGAVSFVLESGEAVERRGGPRRGRILAAASGHGAREGLCERTVEVLEKIGRPGYVVSSANGTRGDAMELEAIRKTAGGVVSSVYGHVAESFSAGALAGIAGVLATGRMPRLMGGARLEEIVGADGSEEVEEFGVICTDYTGLASGVRIACL